MNRIQIEKLFIQTFVTFIRNTPLDTTMTKDDMYTKALDFFNEYRRVIEDVFPMVVLYNEDELLWYDEMREDVLPIMIDYLEEEVEGWTAK